MALVPDQKFSTFASGGTPTTGDVIVGLRGGINTKFNWVLPAGVTTLTGTANQVLVNGGSGIPTSGAVVLTLPQDIATTSNPTFNTIRLNGDFLKGNLGNTVLSLGDVASAVNFATITNAATLGPVIYNVNGTDTNIDAWFVAKGTGGFQFISDALTQPFAILNGTTHQHRTNFAMANTAATRTVTFQDANGTLAYLADIPAGTPSALTRVDDTNVTITLGGTPATALLQAVSLTMGWSGTLSGTRGGTGVNNGASTITLGGSLTTSGAFASTFTMTGITGVTFPTSGTLATTAQIPTGAALTKTDDTNVTLTLGGSPSTALVNAASLTLGWTGQLGLTRGGTAASLTASNGGIVYSTASDLAILAGTATAGQMLQSGASTTPAWSTSTYPATNAVNTLLYASSANVMAALATANSSVLVTSAGGVPSLSTTLPASLTIPAPIIDSIRSAAGTIITAFSSVASAVNYLTITNSATGIPIAFNAIGTDSDIGVNYVSKGTGIHSIVSDALTTPLRILNGTGHQHITNFLFANTNNTRNVTFPDSDGTVLFSAGSGGFLNVQVFAADGTYTPTTGCTKAIVECIAGGGGGGAATTDTTVGGGGAAGGYGKVLYSSPTSQTVTIGAAGTASSGGAGGAGGTSSLGTLISCTGGAGGLQNGAGTPPAGGTPTVGAATLINSSVGSAGYMGGTVAAGALTGSGGFGACSLLGAGGVRGVAGGSGGSGLGYGAGGGGGYRDSVTTRQGGAGSIGRIIVWEYL